MELTPCAAYNTAPLVLQTKDAADHRGYEAPPTTARPTGTLPLPPTHLNQLELCYDPDSVPLFESIRAQPYPVFLDSSQFGGTFGRFDILCADPELLLTQDKGTQDKGTQDNGTQDNGQTRLTRRDGRSERLDCRPLVALRRILLEQGFNGIPT
ncbi:MAG: hypothetical protein ACI9W6_002545, partial [Motiliproteus sp.]